MSADPRKRRRRRLDRGLSLIEVMVSIAILGIASLGLVGGIIISLNSNTLAGRRTQALEFAQARIERLMAMGPVQIQAMLAATGVSAALSTGGATFDPTAPPGVINNGWMMDALEGPPGAAMGTDLHAGPVLRDFTAMTAADDHVTVSRATSGTMMTHWTGGQYAQASCANLTDHIADDPAMLCREIHIEQITQNGINLYRVWVRVLQGGAATGTSVTLQQDIFP